MTILQPCGPLASCCGTYITPQLGLSLMLACLRCHGSLNKHHEHTLCSSNTRDDRIAAITTRPAAVLLTCPSCPAANPSLAVAAGCCPLASGNRLQRHVLLGLALGSATSHLPWCTASRQPAQQNSEVSLLQLVYFWESASEACDAGLGAAGVCHQSSALVYSQPPACTAMLRSKLVTAHWCLRPCSRGLPAWTVAWRSWGLPPLVCLGVQPAASLHSITQIRACSSSHTSILLRV